MLNRRQNRTVWLAWLIIIGLAPLLLLTACLVRVTPAPTPTSAPVPPPVTVDLSGKIDSQGVLLETVRMTSSDGVYRSVLPKGSRLLDAKGMPVKSLTLTPYVPPPSSDGVVAGLAYKWDDVATYGSVDPNGNITISYDPPPANPRIDPSKPAIGVWYAEKNQWAQRTAGVSIDPTTHTISGPQPRLGTTVIIYWYTDVTPLPILLPPAPTPAFTLTPTPTPTPH